MQDYDPNPRPELFPLLIALDILIYIILCYVLKVNDPIILGIKVFITVIAIIVTITYFTLLHRKNTIKKGKEVKK